MKVFRVMAGSLAALLRAIAPMEGGASLYSAIFLLPLAALLPGRVSACNSSRLVVDNDCLTAEATGVRMGDGAISISVIEICTVDIDPDPRVDERCFLIARAKVTSYRERNGKEGYQESEDIPVRTHHADNGPHPVKCLSIGSISSSPGDKGIKPDSWELDIETDQKDEEGNPIHVTYGGSF